jgi:hypothetical protein
MFAASLAGFALAFLTSRLDVNHIVAAVPVPPERNSLAAYLIAVAAALTLAWLPGMIMTAVTGTIAEAVGPYTSATTEALDLGLVVPVAVIAAVHLLTQRPMGRVLALIILVVNVCIGMVLMAQGVAQLVSGVPLTVGEIVTKMLSFAAPTLIASGLLARMALVKARTRLCARTPPYRKEVVHGGGACGLRVNVRQHRRDCPGHRGRIRRVV